MFGHNFNQYIVSITRDTFYILLIAGFYKVYSLGYKMITDEKQLGFQAVLNNNYNYFIVLVATSMVLLHYNENPFSMNLVTMFIAHFIVKFSNTEKSSITYGVGMACSFFEGYLAQIIPSDGADFVGFQENIEKYQNRERVVFPVQKLFIIITKSLYCPPNLKGFNRKKFPYLEACQSFEDVKKDVAGVKNRIYRNSAYKIHRKEGQPVYIAAECATPLHTLHRVLKNCSVYGELCDINVDQVVEDFCTTLNTVIRKNPECQGKCQLVYFDDTNPNVNLADVLLQEIEKIEPDFESVISR
ncbi:unnamed protein product [Leptosia nina]|uniref:STING ligand-binding domain-containing protein n=1 Tax=Leptosia nina TaxID=320188 RepID=A0AAV1JNX5_9NEOP